MLRSVNPLCIRCEDISERQGFYCCACERYLLKLADNRYGKLDLTPYDLISFDDLGMEVNQFIRSLKIKDELNLKYREHDISGTSNQELIFIDKTINNGINIFFKGLEEIGE